MNYIPRYAVWELTNACNAKCLHCGSQSGTCRENELTLEEALRVCDQLKEAGCEKVSLIGGEFFLSPHWVQVCERLVRNGLHVAPLTNGLLLTEKNIQTLKQLGISHVGVSIDGLGETHNRLRGVPHLFERLMENVKKVQEEGFTVGVVTAVSKVNLPELTAIFEWVKGMNVQVWQLQMVEAIGVANKNPELEMRSEDAYQLAKHIANFRRQKELRILTGDNIGYFCSFEPLIRDHPFCGCAAGRQVIGIEANGNIRGCLSVAPSPETTEGNVRERSIAEIWNDPDTFVQYRCRTVEKLTGFCAECKYNHLCRAGCSALAYSLTRQFYENPFCLFKYEVEQGFNTNEKIKN